VKKSELESKVQDFIHHHQLLLPHETIIVAVSGGADSVCMLHLLTRLQEHFNLHLHIAHFNHQLRAAESEADSQYVKELAEQFNIPVTLGSGDVLAHQVSRNCTLEEAARELRYMFFYEVAKKVGAKKIAIGHTLDDNVETIIMHILRGTGLSGLKGMSPCSPLPYIKDTPPLFNNSVGQRQHDLSIVRPLLDVTRDETMYYCQKYQFAPRIDSSNLSLSFYRNRIRLELIPLLKQYNPGLELSLLRLADMAQADINFIEIQSIQALMNVSQLKDGKILLNRAKTKDLPVAIQRQVIRLAIAGIRGNLKDISLDHIESIRGLLSKPVGKEFSLPYSLTCYGEYDYIVITNAEKCKSSQGLSSQQLINIPGETIFPGWIIEATISNKLVNSEQIQQIKLQGAFVADFDLRITGTKLYIRHRQPGDKFQPLGMKSWKSLQNFMVDLKIPVAQRSLVPLVCSSKQIYWVVGFRIDEKAKVTTDTRNMLHLTFIREGSM
jgi:tRNA(Ile)-lysidine synthase